MRLILLGKNKHLKLNKETIVNKLRRVVVTGMGMITSLGHDVKSTWSNILNGKSGVHPITSFDVSPFSTRISSSVRDFNPESFIAVKDLRKIDPFVQYSLHASDEAVADSGIQISDSNRTRIGVSIGSGIGGLSFIEKNHEQLLKEGPRKISPFFIPGAIINMASGQVSIRYGLQGPNLAIATACTTGAHNIAVGARMITHGDADAMIVGGTEMATTPLGLGGFSACKALSTRNDEPQRASRPWDQDRDGFVLGDGAGILVLEEYDHASKRGASIYAELIGSGLSADAYHITNPSADGKGAILAMNHALQDAGLLPEMVDYVNAHATSTRTGDEVEILAIKKMFGSHAQSLAISATKSMTGHLLGASGAVEAIFTVLALRDQVAPPTINLDHPSAGCDLNLVAHQAQSMKINYALSNSFGFGGVNGSLLFARV